MSWFVFGGKTSCLSVWVVSVMPTCRFTDAASQRDGAVAPLLPQFLSYADISVRSSGLYIIILSCFLCVFLKGFSRRLFQLVLFSRTNLQRQEGFFLLLLFVCLLLLLFSNYPNYWEPVFKMKVWMSGVGGTSCLTLPFLRVKEKRERGKAGSTFIPSGSLWGKKSVPNCMRTCMGTHAEPLEPREEFITPAAKSQLKQILFRWT